MENLTKQSVLLGQSQHGIAHNAAFIKADKKSCFELTKKKNIKPRSHVPTMGAKIATIAFGKI